jgi:hypothetical protein
LATNASTDGNDWTIEEQVIEWLNDRRGDWQAKRAARWIKAYGDITIAYAEFTGGHIQRKDMDEVLSRACFGVDLGHSDAE